MDTDTVYNLDTAGLEAFGQLRHEAMEAVSTRFHATYPAEYACFGERGRKACREDIGFHLDFLRPVLEFGLLQPYSEFLSWLAEILSARRIPAGHIRESLLWLAEFFLEKMPGRHGKTIAQALTDAYAQSQQDGLGSRAMDPATRWAEQGDFEAALLVGNRMRALELATRLQAAGHSLIEIEVNLIHPALYTIGHRWQKNEVSVVQEHLATATAQTIMAHLFTQAQLPPPNGKKIMLACVEGNEHAVGLRMVSDAFEMAGWSVRFFGANAPTRSLLEQICSWNPDLVGLSIALPYHLSAAHEAIGMIRSELGERCPPVIVGGSAVNRFPSLVHSLGANGHAVDALAALSHAG